MESPVQKNGEVQRTVTKGNLVVARIYAAEWQKEGSMTAEIRQEETTVSLYPSKRVSNSFQDNIFSAEEFGYEMQPFTSKRTNVAFLLVPVGTTVEILQERLKKFPEACVYRVIDNKPVVTDSHAYAIKQGLLTLDRLANKQVVRYAADAEDGTFKEGDIILDRFGKPQYKVSFFSSVAHEDVNNCNSDPAYTYVTPEIIAEMKGQLITMPSQAI